MWKRIKNNQQGSYNVIENMIVLPIVLLVVFALLFSGFMLHAQCTIESAARRGVLYAGKLICDPQYEKITAGAIDEKAGELNELSKNEFDFTRISHYKPYRYLPLLASKDLSAAELNTQNYVQRIMNQNSTWMFDIDVGGITCDIKNYFITQSVKVKITASYHMPLVFKWLGFPETYDLTAESVLTVSDQDEFIRNVDFVADLLGDFIDNVVPDDVKKAISEPMQKLMSFVNKIFGK